MQPTYPIVVAAVALLVASAACARPAPASPPAEVPAPAGAPAPARPAESAPAPARPKEPIAFAIPQRGVNYVAPLVAAARGYFDEAGLDVKIEALQSNLTIAAMQRGDVQITGSGGSAIRAAVQGAPFRLVALMTRWPTYFLMMQPEYRSPAQLPGTRIGVNNLGGTLHLYLDMYLREQGLDPSQVTVIGLGPNQMQHLAAISAGALDGAVLDPSTAAYAEKQGLYLLKSLGEVAPAPQQGMVVTEDFLQRNPGAVQGFVKSLVRALRLVKESPREAAAVVQPDMGDLDEATTARAVQLYAEAVWGEAPGYADAALLEAFYLYDVKIPLELPLDQQLPAYHDFRYLLQAYDELGIPRPR